MDLSDMVKEFKEELDEAIPPHSLLDISASKSKAELAHKGLLSSRHRPSTEALRAAMLRKSVSHTSSTASFQTADSFDIDRDLLSESREATPDSDSGYTASCMVTVVTTSTSKLTSSTS